MDALNPKSDNKLEAVYKKIARKKPIVCSKVQPWKDPEITHEIILKDLEGCIMKFYLQYRFGTSGYTPSDAISDAYQGILKAIEKDKLAPTIADKTINCPKCNSRIKMPKTLPGDERANWLCMNMPRPLKYRKFHITCQDCDHTHTKKIPKIPFSSLVYPFIRSEIQRGAKKWRNLGVVPMHVFDKNTPTIENKGSILSIDGSTGGGEEESMAIKDLLKAPDEDTHEIPEKAVELLRKTISEMPTNHQIAIAFYRGIGGLVNGIVSHTVKCKNCSKPIEVNIDYSLNDNIAICPKCEAENQIDMRLSQTTIASHLKITKQRVCNILHTAEGKLYDILKHKVNVDLL